jgi:hypothetical protein
MASNTKKTKTKRRQRLKNAGRRRKNVEARKSTAPAGDLFAGCGEPGKPATAPVSEEASQLL